MLQRQAQADGQRRHGKRRTRRHPHGGAQPAGLVGTACHAQQAAGQQGLERDLGQHQRPLAEHVGGTDHGGGQQAEGKQDHAEQVVGIGRAVQQVAGAAPCRFPGLTEVRQAGQVRRRHIEIAGGATAIEGTALPRHRARAACGARPPTGQRQAIHQIHAPIGPVARTRRFVTGPAAPSGQPDIGQPDAHRAQEAAVGRDRRQPIAQRQRRQPREPEQLLANTPIDSDHSAISMTWQRMKKRLASMASTRRLASGSGKARSAPARWRRPAGRDVGFAFDGHAAHDTRHQAPGARMSATASITRQCRQRWQRRQLGHTDSHRRSSKPSTTYIHSRMYV